MKKIWVRAFLILPLSLFSVVAVSEFEWRSGLHYQLLEEPLTSEARDSNKVEVVEFFWYGCSHCYSFEPLLEKWKQQQPDDVFVRSSPAMWHPIMEVHAKAFFALEALQLLDKAHGALFSALNVDRAKLDNENSLARFFASVGIPEKRFRKAFNSFGVGHSVRRADRLARSYQVSGTPQMGINGKYIVASTRENRLSQGDILKVTDYLIGLELQALRGRSKSKTQLAPPPKGSK